MKQVETCPHFCNINTQSPFVRPTPSYKYQDKQGGRSQTESGSRPHLCSCWQAGEVCGISAMAGPGGMAEVCTGPNDCTEEQSVKLCWTGCTT